MVHVISQRCSILRNILHFKPTKLHRVNSNISSSLFHFHRWLIWKSYQQVLIRIQEFINRMKNLVISCEQLSFLLSYTSLRYKDVADETSCLLKLITRQLKVCRDFVSTWKEGTIVCFLSCRADPWIEAFPWRKSIIFISTPSQNARRNGLRNVFSFYVTPLQNCKQWVIFQSKSEISLI